MSLRSVLAASLVAVAFASPATAVTSLTLNFSSATAFNAASVTRTGTNGPVSLTAVATPRLFSALPNSLTNLSQTRAAGQISQTTPGIGVNGGASNPQLDTNNVGTIAAGTREGILISGSQKFRITGLRLSFIDIDDTLQLYGVNANNSFVNLGYPGVITATVTPANTGLTQLSGQATTVSTAPNNGTAVVTFDSPTAYFTRYLFTTRESGATSYLGTNGQGYRIDSIMATVPEPQTWALMILGFGLVGVASRRRKLAVAA